MCNERVLCAGFGGQGVMSMGQLLAYAGMIENRNVTWMPSYGPEMRGGTAYCSVVISENPVGSPIATGNATCAIIMNLPSLLKFESSVIVGGRILVNSSLIQRSVGRRDLEAYYVPANELASQCGNIKVANMVMLGAYLAVAAPVQMISVIEALKKVFGSKGRHLLDMNIQALHRGAEAVLMTETDVRVAA